MSEVTKLADLDERTLGVLEVAKSKGVRVLMVDNASFEINVSEPLLGRDARATLEGLIGKRGTFRSVKVLSGFRVAELGGVVDDDEPGDILDGLSDCVFEAPAGHEYACESLMFTFEPQG